MEGCSDGDSHGDFIEFADKTNCLFIAYEQIYELLLNATPISYPKITFLSYVI